MNFPEKEALNITTQIVVAKMRSSENSINAASGKATADFFKAIFEGVKEITSSIDK